MKNCRRLAAVLLMLTLLFPFLTESARADIVTDTLTVKVGYYGMLPEEYIEVATYRWWELEEALPLHDTVYSFFRSNKYTGEMTTVVDSARGFYLTDLLDYAGIYLGDVSSLSFYTRDQEVGSFVSFTSQELFSGDRYYFENLASHLTPVTDEDGNFLFYDDSTAWDHATVVEPMFALEDNWASFEITNRETPPNFDSLQAGNRFRLLFGQHEPMATETNKSAKYVHTVLVTLSGTAIYTADPPELDSAIGSHTVKMDITVSNDNILGALQSILGYTSTDDTVLQVTGWSVTYSDTASDLVTVEISYDVLAEGDASINGTIGSSGAALGTVKTGSTAKEQPKEDDAGSGTGGETGGIGEITDPDGEDKLSDTEVLIVTDEGLPGLRVELSDEDKLLLEQSETASSAPKIVIPLSAELSAALKERAGTDSEEEKDTAETAETTDDAAEERTALEVAEPVRQAKYVWQTCTAAAVLMLAGAFTAAWTFRKERG